MKLNFHYGLQDANKVLSRLRVAVSTLKKRPFDYFSVESYTNCREQGYAIIGYAGDHANHDSRCFYCAFAQNRNSDSVVVYLATNSGHDRVGIYQPFRGNTPDGATWQNAQYFTWTKDGSHYQEAANFIANEMAIFLSPKYKVSKFHYPFEVKA